MGKRGLTTLELVAKKHNDWIGIVKSFGCSNELAEDLVQEMYIKIHYNLKKGLDVMYNDEINYYYIFKTLNSVFIDLKRKGKNIKLVEIDNLELDHNEVDYIQSENKIKEELSKMFWYDRRVYEIIDSGESIAEFSRESCINYYSLYNTYNKVKNKLKKIL